MGKREISVLITDLDNTLYNWVEVWYKSFSAMLDVIVDEVAPHGVTRDQLISEIKEIHQRYHTSEYAFLIEEIPTLGRLFPGVDLTTRLDSAIHAFRSARKKALKLYPGVMETLEIARRSGTLIVAYTESMAFYTGHRIRVLQLDGVIDFLYSPQDHDFPENLTPEMVRKYPNEHYEFRHTKHRYTPKGELKPNAKILCKILKEIEAEADECIYVGDSLMKDVAMAKDCGIFDVFAQYGVTHDSDAYQLLRDVTHWSDEDVETEKKLKKRDVAPSLILEQRFDEIEEHFDFRPFKN